MRTPEKTPSSTSAATSPQPAGTRHSWRYLPALVGLAVAVSQILTGVDTEGVAITVTAAASCYLAAAALGRPWVAWAGILVSSLAVVLSELAGIPWWVGLAGYAVVLVGVGLRGPTPRRVLADQSLALLGFGGLAVAAVLISPQLGLALAGLTLVSHALWDYRHWRRDDVVSRGLAEFCFLLDVPLGAAAVALALST